MTTNMKLFDNRVFNTFLLVYILIIVVFVGKILLDTIVTPKNISRSTIPALSQERLDAVSKKLDRRKLLTATTSASLDSFTFGKEEPFR